MVGTNGDYPESPLFPRQALSHETLVKLPSKPLAQSASVKLYIILAEPTLFVQGFDETELKSRPPVLLRGCLFIRVLKPVKVKNINLKFLGTSRTDWPEGIPPRKSETVESNTLMQHNWPFFNWNQAYPVSETTRNNADVYLPLKEDEPNADVANLSLDATISPITSWRDDQGIVPTASSMFASLRRAASPSPIRSTPNIFKQLADSSDLASVRSNDDASAMKTFIPGDYIYNFEHPIPSSLPESIDLTFGSVVYNLEATLERSGAFKSSLSATQPVTVVRTPSEESSEESEPISISKEWDNQLAYDIIISSKVVVLNTFLPMAFKLTPLAKIKIHRLRVYLTEHMEYYCRGKRVHRMEPVKKYLLLEHKPPEGVDSLLAVDDNEITAREFEFQVYVPEKLNDKHRLHPDTSHTDIQSHHWIKLCIRVSKANPTAADPKKRKHFEISIDSPMHVFSPLAVHANTLLPAYTSYAEQAAPDPSTHAYYDDIPLSPGVVPIENSLDGIMSPDFHLGANLYQPSNIPEELKSPQAVPFSPAITPEMMVSPELAARGRSSTSVTAKLTRPIQLIRRPSFDPPPFDADIAPPPFSDPPAYSSIPPNGIPHMHPESRRQQSNGDLAGNFNFQGLSPDMPDPIARATSPNPPRSRHASPSPAPANRTHRDISSMLGVNDAQKELSVSPERDVNLNTALDTSSADVHRRGSSFSSERSVPLSIASELSAFDPILAEPLLRNESRSGRNSAYGNSRRGSMVEPPSFRDREQSFDITSLYSQNIQNDSATYLDNNIWQPMDFGMHPPRNAFRNKAVQPSPPQLSSKSVFFRSNRGDMETLPIEDNHERPTDLSADLTAENQDSLALPDNTDTTSLVTSDERSVISKGSGNSGSSMSTLQGSSNGTGAYNRPEKELPGRISSEKPSVALGR
ncbi:unnamed protein product [Kuraishia capsulata CBS 1993]|uniref:Arrestin C-terminal-like domain-containing protein n=1 Tax=Kuraishia capsulata CBS 1993 TaxID=1382522 RepID=W6MPY7_9ASCO|nr:uncharacterized protein KUCA_T00004710001 [Kuraishia capsulata CBS 1993]CDK28726.1 unnamed protein product [Kuraishia capsulata CBS 1993]